jgi:hypothetical protein
MSTALDQSKERHLFTQLWALRAECPCKVIRVYDRLLTQAQVHAASLRNTETFAERNRVDRENTLLREDTVYRLRRGIQEAGCQGLLYKTKDFR